MIKSRKCSYRSYHHSHRVRVSAKPLEKTHHLLMNHGVMRNIINKSIFLLLRWKLPKDQEITYFKEVATFSKLFNRIASIEEYALIAINVGNIGGTRGCRG